MDLPFIGQAYTADSTNLDAQRAVNWFLETAQGPKPGALRQRPCLVSWADSAAMDAVRGLFVLGDRCFAVIGATLYEVSTAGALTSRGTLSTSSGRVGMAGSQTQLMVVDGVYGYILTLASNGLVTISDGDFVGADDVAYLDGLFIVNDPGTNKMRCSGVLDGTSWGALDFASAEASPDDILRVMVDHDELVVFGTSTIEFWYNDAGSNFPFAVIRGSSVSRGLCGTWAATQADNGIFWVGDDGVIYRLNGRSPMRISTHAIESAIRGYADFSDAFAYSYDWDGHKFVCFTFPSGGATWCFDVATGAWHEASSWDTRYWKVSHAVRFADKVIVGSTEAGELYYLSGGVYEDDGEVFERERIAQAVLSPTDWLYHSRLILDFETGVGALSGQGSEPVVGLSWSDDGGHNYGNEIYASLGLTGETVARVVFHRLGRSRSRHYKVRVTDPVKAVLIGARLDAVAA